MTPVSLHECRADGEPRNSGVWFLPHYDRSNVRRTVQAQLREMHRSGFTTLRLLVFYYRTTDASSDDSFTSTDGSIKPSDRTKLADFVRDADAAGFSHLEVVPSFQAENELYCRNAAWGDCFQPSLTAQNWRFIEATARTALAARGRLQLRFDLGNEDAPDPTMPPATLQNAKRYLQFVAGHFQREFGSEWTISTARSSASQATETATRVNLLLDDLRAAGLTPKYLELHSYSGDGNDMTASLDEISAIADRIGASIVLGELRYHSDAQAGAIVAWLRAHPAARVADVIQWPERDPSQVCALDPSPPYTPGPLGAIAELRFAVSARGFLAVHERVGRRRQLDDAGRS
jgi:hypothetical protein